MKLIKVYTDTCGPCKVLESNLKKSGVAYISMNAENEIYSEILEKYNITSVPTLLLLDDGDNVVKRNTGILTVEGIREFIKK